MPNPLPNKDRTNAEPPWPPAVFIMGPTASGKTALAIELIKHFPMRIISVDSAMIYKDMNIGTAKPSAEELAQAPHELIDFLDPAQSYSAANFIEDARALMDSISAAGEIPLLVGGTMMYFKALQEGLSDIPSSTPEVRQHFQSRLEKEGIHALHEALAQVDASTAERLHPNDTQRILRALEVHHISGISLSQWHAKQNNYQLPYRSFKVALIPDDREWLRERASSRFQQMLDEGFLEEVKALHQRGDLTQNMPSMRCVGYRQAWDYIENKIDYTSMVEKAVIATRQLAKRQHTWLKSEQNIELIDPRHINNGQLISQLKHFLSGK